MIRLTKLNGEEVFLNYFQILYIRRIPETKVKLANGDFYLVRDSVESIIEQVQGFLRKCLAFEDKFHEGEDVHEIKGKEREA